MTKCEASTLENCKTLSRFNQQMRRRVDAAVDVNVNVNFDNDSDAIAQGCIWHRHQLLSLSLSYLEAGKFKKEFYT